MKNKRKVNISKIATYFGLSRQSLSMYRNSDDAKLRNRYEAMKQFYIKSLVE